MNARRATKFASVGERIALYFADVEAHRAARACETSAGCSTDAVRRRVAALESAASGAAADAKRSTARKSKWDTRQDHHGRHLLWLCRRPCAQKREIAWHRLSLLAQIVALMKNRSTDAILKPSVMRDAFDCSADAPEIPARASFAHECGL